ncbi:MAG: tRNA (N6-threonylcarbamoyladenosine(37)-N6)-methyltransferase TrmO [Candidatus Bathyarchaeota archaeon]|nr:tRNA (N6-threonylcarbamoyladenosine(37)-N6)-methyltransferase TrmO [Candidatus Bathyarchaeota archaeon]
MKSWKLFGQVNFLGKVEKSGSEGAVVRLFPEFCPGLEGLETFSHAIVLYWIHMRDNPKERSVLQVTPRRHKGAPQLGVFSCRSPTRPNPIGLCIVQILKIDGCTLHVKGLDANESSPIIDIKPYFPRADHVENPRVPKWATHGPST